MAKQDVVLNITARVDEYERRLRETGRFTEKQAAAMARKWERSLVDAQIRAGKAAEKSAKTSQIAWGSAIGVLSADAIKNAARSLLEFTQEMADYRNEIADASTRTALHADTLAGLRLAAEGSGLSFQELNGALLKFSRQGGDADANLQEFLTTLDGMESATEKAAYASKALGEETGPKLLQALGGSGEALRAFTDFARDYGVSVAPEAADASGRWQRLMAALDTQIKGTADSLIGLNNNVDFTLESMTAIGALSIRVAAFMDSVGESFALAGRAIQFTGWEFSNLDKILMGNVDVQKEGVRQVTALAKAYADLTEGDRFTRFVEQGDASLFAWRQSIQAVVDTTERGGANGRGLREIGVAAEEVVPAVQQAKASLEDMGKTQEKWLKRNAELKAEILADEDRMAEEYAAAEVERQQRLADAKAATLNSGFDLARAVADGVVAITEEADARSIQSKRRLAIAQKAAAVFSIALSTAQAVMGALASVQPTVPAGIIAAAAVGATGAVQAGIAASKPLPAFHTGGEIQVNALEGEYMLNQRAKQRVGKETLDALNNGEPTRSGPVPAVLALNDRILDRLMGRALRADGMAGSMVGGRTVALASPYR